jgi:hypothetical protein
MRSQPDWQYTRLILPHHAGRLLLPPDGTFWATVLRLPSGALPDTLTLADWQCRTGDLWIGDVVGIPGVSGVRIGRWLQNALLARGIASPGEIVYFHRLQSARKGWFRTKRANG